MDYAVATLAGVTVGINAFGGTGLYTDAQAIVLVHVLVLSGSDCRATMLTKTDAGALRDLGMCHSRLEWLVATFSIGSTPGGRLLGLFVLLASTALTHVCVTAVVMGCVARQRAKEEAERERERHALSKRRHIFKSAFSGGGSSSMRGADKIDGAVISRAEAAGDDGQPSSSSAPKRLTAKELWPRACVLTLFPNLTFLVLTTFAHAAAFTVARTYATFRSGGDAALGVTLAVTASLMAAGLVFGVMYFLLRKVDVTVLFHPLDQVRRGSELRGQLRRYWLPIGTYAADREGGVRATLARVGYLYHPYRPDRLFFSVVPWTAAIVAGIIVGAIPVGGCKAQLAVIGSVAVGQVLLTVLLRPYRYRLATAASAMYGSMVAASSFTGLGGGVVPCGVWITVWSVALLCSVALALLNGFEVVFWAHEQDQHEERLRCANPLLGFL